MSMVLPKGFKFTPTNDEIITTYLLPKIHGHQVFLGDAITEANIYAINPHSLTWYDVPYLNDYERYYFVRRTALASSDKLDKKNAKRVLETGEGFWRKSHTKEISNYDGQVVGYEDHLNFFYLSDDQGSTKKKRTDAVKTEFIMYEYSLSGDNFQEWVICRIRDTAIQNKRKKIKKLETEQEQQSLHIHEALSMAAPIQPELQSVPMSTENQVEEVVPQTSTADNAPMTEQLLMLEYEMEDAVVSFRGENTSPLSSSLPAEGGTINVQGNQVQEPREDLPLVNPDPCYSRFRIPQRIVYENSDCSLHSGWID